jgi:peptidoglycan/xylan/chitin deacetylase (PgdA/CDA1 family)
LTVLVLFVVISFGLESFEDAPVSPEPKRIALIFDDGPFPNHAPILLELLAKEHLRVTFALVASNVQRFESTARAIIAAGHEVANHSCTHCHPKGLTDAELEREIVGAQRLITETTGYVPKWYWPPFLEVDDRMPALAAKAGIEIYSLKRVIDSKDHSSSASGREIRRYATRNVVDGSVIVFHEWRAETREQLPAILAELRRQNCVFMTFSELAQVFQPEDPTE